MIARTLRWVTLLAATLVTTAAWANELSLMTPRILARLNDGRQGRVKEIRWMPGPLDRPRP